MDVVSYSLAFKQGERIEKFIENPDSTSGLISLPKKIDVDESITIPKGRVVVHPNLKIEGTLTIENDGELFVPFGGSITLTSIMLQSPNGNLWSLQVSDIGVLSVTAQ